MAKHDEGCQWKVEAMAGSDDPDTPYEYSSEQPPSIAIVNALADLEEVDPTELDYTLYDYAYPEALDTLTQSGNVEITFTVEQYKVHITESGSIHITRHSS
ncbi:hypothetical protein HYG81_25100 (plasmid) [Natrinema zhouii]|uniref:HalOD1 output domain-containing protein n=1 Tax=Natrinema zhouii TaxID=1710539 RepID=UPI001CFFDA69|nr:HalOD1 output domain-containing protein [Natrinema zhouii]UHQ99025.1 hypothetical protein HYG81_25100 [Natrinema zhouii]